MNIESPGQAENLSELESLPLKKAQVDGGLEFHYVEQGVGPALVFIHGGSGDYGSWKAQWNAFAPHFRTISYSRRFSRPNNNPLNSPHHSALVDAQDLAALLAHWDAAPAVLVGSSYGAFTALALAIERPELVRAMVLTEPPFLRWADMTPGGRELREDFEQRVRRPAREAFERGDDVDGATILAGGILGQSGLDQLTQDARARRFSNIVAMKMLTLSTDEFPMLDPQRVASLAMPILLLSGKNTQPILAAIFQTLRSVLGSAEAHIVDGSRHSVYREQPEIYNRLALDFLARHGIG